LSNNAGIISPGIFCSPNRIGQCLNHSLISSENLKLANQSIRKSEIINNTIICQMIPKTQSRL